MCGRFTAAFDAQQFRNLTKLPAPPGWAARYNVAPETLIPIVRLNDQGRREVIEARWGLVPSWVSEPADARTLVNARSDSLEEKPSFSASFSRRRCLIPADGFCEWMQGGKGAKPPVYFRFTRPLAMAGIWDLWSAPERRSRESVAIITTDANTMVGHVHSRMPALLDAQAQTVWMNPSTPKKELLVLLKPSPEDFLRPYAVGNAVNNLRNDSRSLIERPSRKSKRLRPSIGNTVFTRLEQPAQRV